jgi:DNA-binding transcriptional ArsR family regulator
MSTPVDDELWSAIGDPTRRQMLDLLLTHGSGTATTLSDRLPVSRQAVAKHLAVLDRAGLVHGESAGRERHYRIDDEQFALALAQLHAVTSAWDGRLRRIKRLAEALQQIKDEETNDG